jgi:DNA-binding MarR family transcriptional regulator
MMSTSRPEPFVRVPGSFDDEFPDCSRLATETFLNIGVLVGTVQAAVEKLVVQEGLPSAAAFNVLSVLAGDPSPLRPSEIAARMMVTRATTTGLLDTLERRGLVRRTVASRDGRSREVRITDPGRRVVERLVPAMHRFERDLMEALPDGRLRQLLAMVAMLQQRIAAIEPEIRVGIR